MALQVRPTELINLLRSEYKALFSPSSAWGDIASNHLLLHGLRGFWPMSSRDEADNVIDLSGQGRTLTNNSATPFILDGLRTYANLDGAADYLSRADEAGLEPGAGLTLGCWVWVDAAGADGVIGKWNTVGNQRSYLLRLTATPTFEFVVSSNGTAETSVASAAVTTGRWYFVAGRYRPSTEIALFVNRTKTVNTTSIPAAIFDSTAAFEIGAHSGANNFLDGRVSLPWLCGDSLYDSSGTDGMIMTLYDLGRPLLNVKD